jgi:phage baseplate assembly protein W
VSTEAWSNSSGNHTDGTLKNVYDGNGYLVQTIDNNNGGGDSRTFVNDAYGHVLQKTQQGNVLHQLISRPFSPTCALISSNNACVRLLSWSIRLNFNGVVASSAASCDRSMPTKSHNARLSHSASSSASSASQCHCCRQYIRSTRATYCTG